MHYQISTDSSQQLHTLAGEPVPLTYIQYRLVAELAAHAGRVLTYEHLLQQVWGRGGRRRHAAHTHRPEQDTPSAGRRPGQSDLHLHRAEGGVQDAQGVGMADQLQGQ